MTEVLWTHLKEQIKTSQHKLADTIIFFEKKNKCEIKSFFFDFVN